jgi:hypothetical protein
LTAGRPDSKIRGDALGEPERHGEGVMRLGPAFPRGEWSTSPLRLFEGDRVQVRLEDSDWVSGTALVVAGGLEIQYDEPRALDGHVESSRILDRGEVKQVGSLLRPETLWTDEVRVRREDQIWRAAHPPWGERITRWTRELLGRDPISAEPLLRRYLGRQVIVEIREENRTLHASGLLLAYDAEFLALADVAMPAEASLPLCPGRTSGADLEAHWNEDGLELFNRGKEPVEILGIRTSAGLRPWEFVLRPGFRERTGFCKAPAGTAELVFESPVRGDAILPRAALRVRGGAEGAVTIPALPDPSTLMRDLPDAPAPGSAARRADALTFIPENIPEKGAAS